MPVRPTLIEGAERTNIVVVRNFLQGQEGRSKEMKKDPYVMDVDRERNCYSCRGFSHLAQNYESWRIIGQERRVEYRDNLNNGQNNLNGEESLIILN